MDVRLTWLAFPESRTGSSRQNLNRSHKFFLREHQSQIAEGLPIQWILSLKGSNKSCLKQQLHSKLRKRRILLTCERLKAVELKDISFQHLNPWTANFRRQLGTYRKQPGGGHKRAVKCTVAWINTRNTRKQLGISSRTNDVGGRGVYDVKPGGLTSGTWRPASAFRWNWAVPDQIESTLDNWRDPSSTPGCPFHQLCSCPPRQLH